MASAYASCHRPQRRLRHLHVDVTLRCCCSWSTGRCTLCIGHACASCTFSLHAAYAHAQSICHACMPVSLCTCTDDILDELLLFCSVISFFGLTTGSVVMCLRSSRLLGAISHCSLLTASCDRHCCCALLAADRLRSRSRMTSGCRRFRSYQQTFHKRVSHVGIFNWGGVPNGVRQGNAD